MGAWDLLEGGWMEGPDSQTGGGTGWEKSLAGDGFRGLRRAISHRGDRGAVCHREPDQGAKIPYGRRLTGRRASISLR